MFNLKKIDVQMKSFTIEDEAVINIEKNELLKILELVYLIREFENKLLELKDKELVYGPVHSSIGQEAIAAGCGIGLRRNDIIGSTHRAHHHFLAKAISYYYPNNYNPLINGFSEKMQNCVSKTMAEIMGLKNGWCGGRGGSMHLSNREAGIIGTNAIVGGGIALTSGAAWAQNLKNLNSISIAFLGDGAVNQGILYESMNMAKLLGVPVIYFVENNLYAVGTSTKISSCVENIAQRALAFNMDGIIVDGMDPIAIYLLVKEIINKVEKKKEPYFVEAKTYRFYHHAGKMPGSKLKYRTKEEEERWRKRDPYKRFSEQLKALNILTKEEDNFIKGKIKEVLKLSESKVTKEENGKIFIPNDYWPSEESLKKGMLILGDEFKNVVFCEKEDFSKFVKITFVNVISQVMARNMEKDSSIIVLGEEVANLGGGAYNATRSPLNKYPERVINTPISEAGFTGIAFGASLLGIKPLIEIMFPDFALVAADQLFNQIAKLKYLYGGEVNIPLVVRTRVATGLGYGAQHSSDPSGLFAMFPAWRIVAPSNPFDYIGLFNSAVISNDPVLVIEHHSFYRKRGEIPKNDMDYFIKFGKAKIFNEGKNITIVTYLNGVNIIKNICNELEEKGISIEGIDLRSIDYNNIDYETIGRSLKKTGRLIIMEEAPKSMGIGARIADEVQYRFFPFLRKPIFHINSLDVPLPVSKKLEEVVIINEDKVKTDIEFYMNH